MMDLRQIAEAFTEPGAPVRMRQGVVLTVNADGTVNVTIGGSAVVVPSVRKNAGYAAAVGDVVWLATDGRDAFVLCTLVADPWHLVGGSGEPAFANGWVNYGGTYTTARFRRNAAGMVEIQGMIKSGTMAAPAFILPTAYRPGANLAFSVVSNDAFGRVDVRSDGSVFVDEGSATWVSLSGISYHL